MKLHPVLSLATDIKGADCLDEVYERESLKMEQVILEPIKQVISCRRDPCRECKEFINSYETCLGNYGVFPATLKYRQKSILGIFEETKKFPDGAAGIGSGLCLMCKRNTVLRQGQSIRSYLVKGLDECIQMEMGLCLDCLKGRKCDVHQKSGPGYRVAFHG